MIRANPSKVTLQNDNNKENDHTQISHITFARDRDEGRITVTLTLPFENFPRENHSWPCPCDDNDSNHDDDGNVTFSHQPTRSHLFPANMSRHTPCL